MCSFLCFCCGISLESVILCGCGPGLLGVGLANDKAPKTMVIRRVWFILQPSRHDLQGFVRGVSPIFIGSYGRRRIMPLGNNNNYDSSVILNDFDSMIQEK